MGAWMAVAACTSTPNGVDGALVHPGSDAGPEVGSDARADGGADPGDARFPTDGAGGCTFSIDASLSPKIGTVGVVNWSANFPDTKEAHIDFGLTPAYEMVAPAPLVAPDGTRTLLLGMKPSRTYHFRVEVSGGGAQCTSGDRTITTGPVVNGLASIVKTVPNPAAAFGGFLVTGQYVKFASASGVPAYILDADAEVVWWHFVPSDATSARMTHDGSAMWINGVNVPSGTASVHRVSMDGVTDEDHSSEFVGLNHQLTVLPDDSVVFDAYGANGCDDIKRWMPGGAVTTIVNAQAAHGGTGTCHVNAIGYSSPDDTLVFSDLENNDLTKITLSGATVWVLNGVGDTFTGDSWSGGQHGFHLLGLDDLVLFNNNDTVYGGTGTGSAALEMKLDLGTMTATRVWSYLASPAIENSVLGDVQRLPNGNTVVAYSTAGIVDEVDAAANLVQEWRWSTSLGYIEKRATLYGPPPR